MRYFVALLAVLLVAAAWAIDPPRPQTPAPPPPQAPVESPAAQAPVSANEPPPEAPAEEEETLPPLPDDVPAGPPPARFNPTEKVRADFPVSFPVDI